MSYPIETIADYIAARRVGETSATISWLLTDSRSLSFPEETLFFALQSKRNNGARYLPDLYARGVRNFVVSEADMGNPEFTATGNGLQGANLLVVPNTLKALQKLAERHRTQFDIPVIGITGSNGKTVVKEWLHQLLSPNFLIARSPRSYNSQIGVPLSVWQLGEQTRLGIFEAGISEPGEMRALKNIIQPTIGILTNIGGAHQENFFSLQEKCIEKLGLFKDCDILIYNGDDEFIVGCVSRVLSSAREIAWSRKNRDCPLYINKVEKGDSSTRISYHYLGMPGGYTLPFIDDASIENSLHCLAACHYLMLSAEEITARMEHLEPVAMRLEVKEGKNNCLLINDSYNSDLVSLDIALDFLYRRSLSKGLKRTLILSDLLETGQNAALLYRKVQQLLHSRQVERIIGVGREIGAQAARFDIEKAFYPDTQSLLHALTEGELRIADEIVLIKGAHSFGFDRLTEELEKKVHETIMEVNLGAMVDNLNFYRSRLRPDTKVICMVKAAAYGTGSQEVAKTLQEHRADYLAVAVADEGYELRRAGITAGILIMNPEMTSFRTLFDCNLEPEIYSFGLLEALIKEAERAGITHFPVHIEIDTGMHRLGFAPEEVPQLIERLRRQDALIVRSVFSHFVAADSPQHDDFTRQQMALFEQASAQLTAAFPHRIFRHLCNSAGAERFPEAQYDMVRLGIGLYGVNPTGRAGIHNVSTLKTTILQLRDVPQADTVGYNRNGKLTRNSRIATLPIGYADGLNRHLGNGHGYCLVNGCRAPYVGNICMDVCMIDVTDIDCHEGDRVEIFGDNLPIKELSDALDTIPYEILTAVSTRVKRVYFQE
ncbi:MAG: bifunctional UDP-N-acetylmuramoyl-tripeptide:D-alanyl-D-alanine ligase/alanine racemase [Prevotellaceae bacterium]|jgi:alanine racemase|nr:bifunctional UDP-N-acetylmuramoyl-tripeptide:D-alanyl-D-alanine ligase/alanine racemase [Prevotellaceae bacterium]